ncbi:MAG: protoglobin domain-containing protein, partial [Microcystaceae cyanobacterium]
MALNASEFMQKMENRMIFSNEDKATLKSYAEWGNKVAPEMADHFYAYLQRDEEMNAMISEPPERMERLHKTFIQ